MSKTKNRLAKLEQIIKQQATKPRGFLWDWEKGDPESEIPEIQRRLAGPLVLVWDWPIPTNPHDIKQIK